VALVKPFRALRYDTERAGPLAGVVAPPHDVVRPGQRELLHEASPYNAIRLTRPDDPAEAGRLFHSWVDEGVLVRETEPAVWILEETYTGPDGAERTRRSLVARVRMSRYGEGEVFPHERTFRRQKQVRLELLRATRTKLSPVFFLHEGSTPGDPQGAPDLEVAFDGVTSRLWRVSDPVAVEAALGAVRGPLIIADGHHRYETALRFHEGEGTEETAYVLGVLVAHDDPGLEIFPTHRLSGTPVPEPNGRFRLTELGGGAADALARLGELPRDRPAFVLLRPGGATLAETEPVADGPAGELDTAVLDGLGLDDVRFTPSAEEAERAVASGEAAAAFLVRAPTVEQVEAVALAGETMPQKSTYFFPKLTSGLLFAPFDE
jgi:uncharacterized protein (DUF1015 family)